MKQEYIKIQHIPTILWGEKSDRILIAAHGNMSHKSDTVIERLAQAAESKGYQVLSFDLPEHGDRKSEPTLHFGCRMTVLNQGEYFFHSPEQLAFYEMWLKETLQ